MKIQKAKRVFILFFDHRPTRPKKFLDFAAKTEFLNSANIGFKNRLKKVFVEYC